MNRVAVLALSLASLVAIIGLPQGSAEASPQSASVLWNQLNHDGSQQVSSQDFDPFYDQFDDEGADDFIVPTGQRWTITGIRVKGVYVGGPGPASNEVVTFYYDDGGGLPGSFLTSRTVTGVDHNGSFTIPLSPAVSLPVSGSYWVSVRATMDLALGQWGWEGRLDANGNEAAWRNYQDGFGTGCMSWGYARHCLEIQYTRDLMFALAGTRSHA